MLSKSFLASRETADLGVDLSAAPVNLPSYTEQRANVALYLAPLFCLEVGRRDLAPLAWAWTKANMEHHAQYWTPEIQEHVPDVLWATRIAEGVSNLLIDNRIPYVIPAQPHDVEGTNLALALHKVTHEGKALAGHWREGDDGMMMLLERLDVPAEAVALLSFVASKAVAATLIAMLCQSSVAKREKDVSDAANRANLAIARSLPHIGTLAYSVVPRVIRVFEALEATSDMAGVWDACVRELFPRQGRINLPEALNFPTGNARRDYRWLNGKVDDNVAAVRDRCAEQSLEQATAEAVRLLPPAIPVSPDTLRSLIRDAHSTAVGKLDDYVAVSFYTQELFDAFAANGSASVWEKVGENEDAFEYRFTDNPLYAQSIIDSRLWGEKGDPMTKAYWLPRDDRRAWEPLARMFGPIAVVWAEWWEWHSTNPLMKSATVTLGASQTAPFALPVSEELMARLMVPFVVAKAGEERGHLSASAPGMVPLLSTAFFGCPIWPDFMEVQIHEWLTLEDVTEVINLNE